LLDRVQIPPETPRLTRCRSLIEPVPTCPLRRLTYGAASLGDYRLDWPGAQRFSVALCAEAGMPGPLVEHLSKAAAAIDTAADSGSFTAAIRAAVAAVPSRR